MPIKDSQLADAMKARLFLMFGGPLGFHRLYLGQYPEAFMFLTTLGGCFLGLIVDTFKIHQLVEDYNAEKQEDYEQKERLKEDEDEQMEALNGELLEGKKAKAVNGNRKTKRSEPFNRKFNDVTAAQFTMESAYGIYLGLLAWLSLEFVSYNGNHELSFFKILVVSISIASGVYIAGNIGNRKILFWVCLQGALVVMFVVSYISTSTVVLCAMTSCSSAIFGHIANFYMKDYRKRKFGMNDFFFWTSLFSLLIATIFIGISRHVFDLKLTVKDIETKGTSTSSLGTLAANYLFYESEETIRFFSHKKEVFYGLPKSDQDDNRQWINYISAAVTDALRYSINEKTHKNATLPSTPKWVAWRTWLLVNTNLSPFATDKKILKKCGEINSQMPTDIRLHFPNIKEDSVFSPSFACHRFSSGLRAFQ
ncbi:hypothetical protein L596_010911 [Steinernema carpocapsae]|uniref:TM2 domain-containing protein n=1 Tax=Steinernema carpocapsae TaxID=34508 RepID=A0A4U5PMJ3_STECR|nr:hypothetical protein L596_010911 [Steinernema carpocapsae]